MEAAGAVMRRVRVALDANDSMPDSTLNRIGAHVWRIDDRVEAQTNDGHGASRTETGLLLAKVLQFSARSTAGPTADYREIKVRILGGKPFYCRWRGSAAGTYNARIARSASRYGSSP